MSGLRSGIGFVLIGTSVAASLVPSSARAACGGGGMSAPSAPPSVGPLNGGVETAAATSDPAIAKAQKHFIAGGKAYNAADYSTAEHEFKQAESMTVKYSSPALDRQLGQTNEKLKRPRVAIKYYQRFIVQHFWGTEADEVNARISALETEASCCTTAELQRSAASRSPARSRASARSSGESTDWAPGRSGGATRMVSLILHGRAGSEFQSSSSLLIS